MLLPSTHNANSLLINGEDEGHFIYTIVITSVVVYLPAQFSFLMVFFFRWNKMGEARVWEPKRWEVDEDQSE